MGEDEGSRIAMLLDAQDKAAELFAEIERTGMIRAGENTLQPYRRIRRTGSSPTTTSDALTCSATTRASILCETTCPGCGPRDGSTSSRIRTSREPSCSLTS